MQSSAGITSSPTLSRRRSRQPAWAAAAASLALVLAASGSPSAAERQATGASPEAVAAGALDQLAHGDEQGFKQLLTPDFVAIDAGERLNGDALWRSVRDLRTEGVQPDWHVQDFVVHQKGNTAWADYRNVGGMSRKGRRTPLVWLESAVFVRGPTGWRMALLHSTLVTAR
jgi:hypothetical protein